MRNQVKGSKLALGVLLFAAAAWSGVTHAALVKCPATSTDGNRQGQLETDPVAATCLDYGYGNIGQGNPLQDDFLQGNGELGVNGAADGWQLISNGDSLLSLPKTVSGIDWTGYSQLALFFKVGGGTYCPSGLVCTGANQTGDKQPGFDWFVFELPNGETSATFTVLNNRVGGGGLSHWGIYGVAGTSVPEPGALSLLGLGLVVMGLMRRRTALAGR